MRLFIPLLLCLPHVHYATALSSDKVELVKARLKEAAQKSWELGTRAQALLELEAPSISVFTASSIPGSPASHNNSGTTSLLAPVTNAAKIALASGQLKDILKITTDIVSSRPDGSLALMKDGSAADPASNGVAVLVANWTQSQGPDFASAASDQLTWLLEHVPRSAKGAISHRNNAVQLWSDFIYMVPSFLAYYGATTSNKTLVAESYHQIKLYREALLDKSGLWQHIRQGSFEDTGRWSTGNGWAAMGMMRVAATIKAAGYENEFSDELKDLDEWTAGIFDSMWPLLTEDNLFYNYADNSKTFLDAASSALMTASVYRAAVLFNNTKHIDSAEKVYATIGGSTPSSSIASPSTTESSTETETETTEQETPTLKTKRRSHSRRSTHHRVPLGVHHNANAKIQTRAPSQAHIDPSGWLTPVVDPHSFHKLGKESAEGQAFVLMMYAARNDWAAANGDGGGGLGLENRAVSNIAGLGVVAGSPASVGSGSGSGSVNVSGGGLSGPVNVIGTVNTTATTTGLDNGSASVGAAKMVSGALVATSLIFISVLV